MKRKKKKKKKKKKKSILKLSEGVLIISFDIKY